MTAPRMAAGPRIGHGTAGAHHGELLQGLFHCTLREDWCPALVTLPITDRQAHARFIPDPDPDSGVRVVPVGKDKARRAAELVLEWCADRGIAHPPGGELACWGDVPEGLGMGSSTADVIATIRAVVDSCALGWGPEDISALAVRAEQASDPLVFDGETVLFGHRHGHVLRRWRSPVPSLLAVGCRTGPGTVDTLAHAAGCPAPSAPAVREYARLLEMFGTAIEQGSPQLVGRVATRSALLNQALLPHPELDTLLEVCHATGGVGIQVAHSGCVASVLLDGSLPAAELHARAGDCRSALDSLGLEATLTTRTGDLPARRPANSMA